MSSIDGSSFCPDFESTNFEELSFLKKMEPAQRKMMTLGPHRKTRFQKPALNSAGEATVTFAKVGTGAVPLPRDDRIIFQQLALLRESDTNNKKTIESQEKNAQRSQKTIETLSDALSNAQAKIRRLESEALTLRNDLAASRRRVLSERVSRSTSPPNAVPQQQARRSASPPQNTSQQQSRSASPPHIIAQQPDHSALPRTVTQQVSSTAATSRHTAQQAKPAAAPRNITPEQARAAAPHHRTASAQAKIAAAQQVKGTSDAPAYNGYLSDASESDHYDAFAEGPWSAPKQDDASKQRAVPRQEDSAKASPTDQTPSSRDLSVISDIVTRDIGVMREFLEKNRNKKPMANADSAATQVAPVAFQQMSSVSAISTDAASRATKASRLATNKSEQPSSRIEPADVELHADDSGSDNWSDIWGSDFSLSASSPKQFASRCLPADPVPGTETSGRLATISPEPCSPRIASADPAPYADDAGRLDATSSRDFSLDVLLAGPVPSANRLGHFTEDDTMASDYSLSLADQMPRTEDSDLLTGVDAKDTPSKLPSRNVSAGSLPRATNPGRFTAANLKDTPARLLGGRPNARKFKPNPSKPSTCPLPYSDNPGRLTADSSMNDKVVRNEAGRVPSASSANNTVVRNEAGRVPSASSINDTVIKNQAARLTSTGSMNDTVIRTPLEDDTDSSTASIAVKRNVRVRSPRSTDYHFYEEPKDGTDVSVQSTPSQMMNNKNNKARQPQPSDSTVRSTACIDDYIQSRKQRVQTGQGFAPPRVALAPMAVQWNQAKSTGSSFASGPDLDDTINLDDPTDASIRPSQPPAHALASVLEQLREEVLMKKKKVRKYQDHYDKRSPGASREKRTLVKNKIFALMADIDHRSDQIYSLTDVLVGQEKAAEAAAPLMTEVEVDDTLNSMGLSRYGDDDSRFSAAGTGSDLS